MDENHKRVLSNSFLIIEEDLRTIISELQAEGKTDTIFYSKVNDINQLTTIKIFDGTEAMLQQIRRLKEEAGLETREKSMRKEVYSLVTEIWILLEDLRPEKLKAYGALTEIDKEFLRLHVHKLLRIVDNMLMAFD